MLAPLVPTEGRAKDVPLGPVHIRRHVAARISLVDSQSTGSKYPKEERHS